MLCKGTDCNSWTCAASALRKQNLDVQLFCRPGRTTSTFCRLIQNPQALAVQIQRKLEWLQDLCSVLRPATQRVASRRFILQADVEHLTPGLHFHQNCAYVVGRRSTSGALSILILGIPWTLSLSIPQSLHLLLCLSTCCCCSEHQLLLRWYIMKPSTQVLGLRPWSPRCARPQWFEPPAGIWAALQVGVTRGFLIGFLHEGPLKHVSGSSR